jgi:hypothetical protein
MHPKKVAFLLFVFVIALAVGVSVPLYAQVAGGSLSGTISDPQGAAIAGAKIAMTNPATGVVTETTTNAAGAYDLVNILPASYKVAITAPGFRTGTSTITITVGSQQTLNLAMTVGEVAQTVEVTGAAPIIETTNATLAGNIQSEQIVELPLNGRDWASLATLEPGVVQVRPHEQVTQPGGNLRGLGNQMTIDGNRPTQNVYRLNGVIVNDYSNAGPGNVLGASIGVDAIQEFSVLTANYSAEYGLQVGWLNGHIPVPSNIPPVLARTWAGNNVDGSGPGLTTTDLQNILDADPFSNPNYTVAFGQNPFTTSDGRFTVTDNPVVDYEPNVTQGYSDGYTITTTQSQTATYTYELAYSVEEKFMINLFFQSFSSDLKNSNTLTWTNKFSQATNNSQGQLASLSITGPAPGYTGPPEFVVYQDNVYGTFMFYPNGQ